MGSVGFGGGKSSSSQRVFPGVYETSAQRRAFGDQIRPFIMAGAAPPPPRIASYSPTQSSFFNAYQSALKDRFTPTSAESDLLGQISDRTSAAFAARGLGATPIAASSTAASVAPSLVAMRNSQIENLRQALAGDVTAATTVRGQDIDQRGADMTAGLEAYRAKLQGLLNFFEQAYFPRSLGAESKSWEFDVSGSLGGEDVD